MTDTQNTQSSNNPMDAHYKHVQSAVRHIRRTQLAALTKIANKCLASFPAASVDVDYANFVFNLVASQVQEATDVFLQQFASVLDRSCREAWIISAQTEASEMMSKLEETK